MQDSQRLWCRNLMVLISLGVAMLIAMPIVAAEVQEDAWPREIDTERGLVVMYQPQVDSLEDNILKGRSAVMLQPKGAAEPIFGAVWLEVRIDTDLDRGEVFFEDIQVPQVRLQDATEEQERDLIDLLTREIPTWNIDLSVDRLIPMLDIAERQDKASEGFEDSPPKILFREEPTVLVTIDGEPQLRRAGDSEVQAVVNSPFLIAQHPKGQSLYYLYAGAEAWYEASSVMGPWKVTKKKNVPKKVRQLQPEDEEVDPEEAAEGPSTPPAIVVTTEPAELVVSDGPPKYEPIAGSELLIVTNTESDVLREVTTQQIYLLLSGRWFTSKTTDGPWVFARPDQLADAFSEIDPEGDYGHLLAWVAGTQTANEAVLDASIPQTAAIKRDATIRVTYDGEPNFEPVEETSLFYAVNTESQVIKAGTEYYCVEEGAWYVATAPKGPWRVATEIPDEIQAIPPSSPVYNTKYVEIFDSTAEVAYVGYYPGYTNSYVYYGVPVYGTGWYYNPWWSPYHYYPRHRTWGFHMRWNPWYGWGFGFGYSTGRYSFGIGFGGWYGRGWWGPGGYRGYRRGYNRGWNRGYRSGRQSGYRSGYRSAKRDTARNMYQRSGNSGRVAKTSARGEPGAAGNRTPQVASTRANNVFADKNGNVHRREQDGSWDQRQGGQWKGSEEARDAGASQRGRSRDINRDYNARQRGNQRARSAPRGGRGGGGRRR